MTQHTDPDAPQSPDNPAPAQPRPREAETGFGADVVAGLCQRLQDAGVRDFHFYTLNRAQATLEVCRRVGWLQKEWARIDV